jgi:hypothetical protein
VETTLPSVNLCLNTKLFALGILTPISWKNTIVLIYWKPTQEAEIAAMIALKQYFEDQK